MPICRFMSPRRDTTEEDEGSGWVPIPGKLHPTGLDEVVAMQHGFFPVRKTATPLDEDGKKSDIVLCDRVITEWLTLHGQQDDAECVELANVFAEAGTGFDIKACSSTIVFVSGNTKFVELLRKGFAGVQQLFLERRVVDKPRDVPFRVWHIELLSTRGRMPQ
ncbi:hypothetical protein SELMODRAFT_422832 [Selaginella moellendorffii]|uniref:Uncharacterized protein n=1 Tax=Selaginella moellendorffii TaxID=88036 RepID=D8SJP4_SELML|nr:hypothetical protein SELMODRAFT_422832 [Selaginella moellendorffii]